jgi:putative glutamine amidotransferase
VIVGVTDDRVNEEKYLLYEAWLTDGHADVEIVRLTPGDGNGAALARCDGIVFTGGGDIDPGLYGGDPRHHTLYEISPGRDAFESDLVKRSLDAGIPILGICRGMQLVNVALGGSLITDLEEAGHPPHRTVNGVKCRHDVKLEPGARLTKLLGVGGGAVTSSHHQAVDRIGAGLAVAAHSGDGVVEALEMAGPGEGARVILVQWHPERMSADGSPLSGGLRKVFFKSLTTE